MGSTVSMGGLEVSSNHETAEEMVKALTPADADAKQPKVIKDGGKLVEEPENPLSKAGRELGKAGGEAAAKARKEAKADEPEEKPAEKEPEAKEAKPAEDEVGDPRNDAKARIRELARERAEERAQRMAVQEELARLKAAPMKPLLTSDDEAAPRPEQFPNNYEAYVEAVAEWKAEHKFREHQKRAESEREANAHAEAIAAKVEAFNSRVSSDPDYLTKVDPRILDLKPSFMLAPGEIPGPLNVIGETLVTSEQAVELSIYLTENPKEMERLIKLPNALEIARAVGRIEDKLAAKAEEPEPVETVSKAPPPLKPITPSSIPGVPDLTGEIDFDTFSKRRGANR